MFDRKPVLKYRSKISLLRNALRMAIFIIPIAKLPSYDNFLCLGPLHYVSGRRGEDDLCLRIKIARRGLILPQDYCMSINYTVDKLLH